MAHPSDWMKNDPMRPKVPDRILQTALKEMERPRHETVPREDRDPKAEFKKYVEEKWVQQLQPLRTKCYRCGKDSPIVHIPIGGIPFGNPGLLKKMRREGDPDMTEAAIEAFAAEGWRFQLRKSYCPMCKGLGAI
jgi:hypothetical protein